MSEKGSAGNVLSAFFSFLVPGLGQLCQGRFIFALLYFFLSIALWVFLLGWIAHILAAFDAAVYSENKITKTLAPKSAQTTNAKKIRKQLKAIKLFITPKRKRRESINIDQGVMEKK